MPYPYDADNCYPMENSCVAPTLTAMGEEGFNDEGQLEGESPIPTIPLAFNLPPPQLVTCREDHLTNPFTRGLN